MRQFPSSCKVIKWCYIKKALHFKNVKTVIDIFYGNETITQSFYCRVLIWHKLYDHIFMINKQICNLLYQNYEIMVRYLNSYSVRVVWFGFMFNGISNFGGYLMPKPFSKKNSSGTI